LNRAAFTIRDLLVSIVALVSLAAISIPALSQVRMDSLRQACIGNYRFIAQASGSYSNDFGGQMWAFSWKRGMPIPGISPTHYFGSDMDAQAWQAVVIMRRLAGLKSEDTPVPQGWISSLFYSHIALADYVNLPLPASYLICPADVQRQRFLDGDFSHLPGDWGDGAFTSWRMGYSSSYSVSPSHWGPSRQTTVPAPPIGQLRKSAMWYSTGLYASYDGDLIVPDIYRPHQESEVRFPSGKVFLSDDYARHNGKTRYYAYQTAAQDMLFYDGSVRFFRTDSTNPGWRPTSASGRGNMTSRYSFTVTPDYWGTLDNNAAQASFTAGWYRTTRGGLFGWDVPRLSSMVGKLPNANIVENEVDTSAATGTW